MDFFHQGNVHYVNEDYDSALQVRILSIHTMAIIFASLRDEFLQAFSQAVEHDSNDARFVLHKGTAQLKLRRFEDAVATLQQAEQLTPDNDVALYRLG